MQTTSAEPFLSDTLANKAETSSDTSSEGGMGVLAVTAGFLDGISIRRDGVFDPQ